MTMFNVIWILSIFSIVHCQNSWIPCHNDSIGCLNGHCIERFDNIDHSELRLCLCEVDFIGVRCEHHQLPHIWQMQKLTKDFCDTGKNILFIFNGISLFISIITIYMIYLNRKYNSTFKKTYLKTRNSNNELSDGIDI